MALNGAGTIPPQEEGLFSNSWNGKFHLEMHPWHSAHFALWGRTELLERSMPWYLQHLPAAKARAEALGMKGAMWPKMVGPEGRESPSTINPFIIWQQPHPILLAELIYRSRSSSATLTRYRDLVFETGDLLASLPSFDEQRDAYIIGPPVVPAQEVFPPLTTFKPAFEVLRKNDATLELGTFTTRCGAEPRSHDICANAGESQDSLKAWARREPRSLARAPAAAINAVGGRRSRRSASRPRSHRPLTPSLSCSTCRPHRQEPASRCEARCRPCSHALRPSKRR